MNKLYFCCLSLVFVLLLPILALPTKETITAHGVVIETDSFTDCTMDVFEQPYKYCKSTVTVENKNPSKVTDSSFMAYFPSDVKIQRVKRYNDLIPYSCLTENNITKEKSLGTCYYAGYESLDFTTSLISADRVQLKVINENLNIGSTVQYQIYYYVPKEKYFSVGGKWGVVFDQGSSKLTELDPVFRNGNSTFNWSLLGTLPETMDNSYTSSGLVRGGDLVFDDHSVLSQTLLMKGERHTPNLVTSISTNESIKALAVDNIFKSYGGFVAHLNDSRAVVGSGFDGAFQLEFATYDLANDSLTYIGNTNAVGFTQGVYSNWTNMNKVYLFYKNANGSNQEILVVNLTDSPPTFTNLTATGVNDLGNVRLVSINRYIYVFEGRQVLLFDTEKDDGNLINVTDLYLTYNMGRRSGAWAFGNDTIILAGSDNNVNSDFNNKTLRLTPSTGNVTEILGIGNPNGKSDWTVSSTGIFRDNQSRVYGIGTGGFFDSQKSDEVFVLDIGFSLAPIPDTTAPDIIIEVPINNSNYTTASIDLNITSSATDVSTWWYTNSSGEFNYSFLNLSFNLTGATQPIWDEGHNFVIVYINDTSANNNSASVNFTVDTSLQVLLETPAAGQASSINNINFSCSIIAPTNNVDNVTFDLWDNTGAKEAETFRDLTDGLSQNESFFQAAVPDDSYTWNCFYVDVVNTLTTGNNRSLTVDTINPVITLDIDSLYSSVSVPLNYSFTEVNPNTCKYSLDAGVTNTSFASCGINASVTASIGNNTATVFINDTSGRESSDSESFNVLSLIEIINQTTALETSSQTFQIGVVNGSSTLDSATLTYNNTAFPFNNFHSNGTTLFVNRSITLGLFNLLQTNQSFYWNLTFIEGSDSLIISTPIVVQAVDQMFIGNCSEGQSTTQVLNFTILDEVTNNPLNATAIQTQVITWNRTNTLTRQFNFNTRTNISVPSINGTSNFAYCISPSYAQFSSDYFVQYGLDGFENREYHVDSGILNTTQQNINLFLASLSDAETITITVVDENGKELEGIVVEAHKKNIGSGNFTIVDIQETNPDGQVNMELIRGGNFYKFVFKQEGVVKLTTQEFKLSETSYTFTLTLGGAGLIDILSDIETITHSLTFNSSGSRNFTFTWNDPSDIADSFRFTVSNLSFSNGTQLTFEQSSTNQTGIMFFQIGNLTSPYIGTFLAQAFATLTEDSKEHLLDSLTIEIKDAESVLPPEATRDGLLFSLIVILTLFGIGMAIGNPSVYIGLGVVSIWVMSLFFMGVSTTAVITLAIIGIIFIWRLRT